MILAKELSMAPSRETHTAKSTSTNDPPDAFALALGLPPAEAAPIVALPVALSDDALLAAAAILLAASAELSAAKAPENDIVPYRLLQ